MRYEIGVMVVVSVAFALLVGCERASMAPVEREAAAPKAPEIAMRIPPAATIVISAGASPSEKHAANELQDHLVKICSVRPEIRTDAEEVAGPMILVGDSRYVKQLAPDIKFAELGLEGFIIRTVDGNLILAGGRRRGSMYAVYDFLENHLGCRWFTTDCVTIPKKTSIELPPINERKVPVLEYRDPYFTEARDALWATRNRMNSVQTDEMGGKIKYGGFCHTFYPLLPPAKYFKDHPEYYSEINGKRTCQNAQLCLTNPDVVRLVTEAVKEIIRKNPDVDIVSVTQNDCAGYCTCPKCKEIADREGSQSGPMINFVNQIADNIRDEFPHVAIDTFAYQYTRKPPKAIKPRPNVIVRLCSIECCFSHPLATCPENKTFVDDIVGWNKLCNRLYIWDYVTDFAHYMMPFPDLRVIQPNTKFFVEHGTKGIFEEGAYPKGGGAESGWLRSYLMAKSLWNPNCDPNAAMSEFIAAYYGPAAEPVRKYYDLIHDRVEKDNIHVRIYEPPKKFFTPALLDQCAAQLDDAEKRAANDAVISRRLRQLRMWFNYARVSMATETYTREGNRIVLTSAGDSEAAARQFAAAAKEFGVQQIREGQPFNAEDWLSARGVTKKEFEIVTLANPAQTVEIVPAAGGRMYKWLDKKSGQGVLRVAEQGKVVGLTDGGYEEYSESKYRSPGWNEPYAIAKRDAKSLQVEAALRNGMRLSRTYRADDVKPMISIASTVTNSAKEAKAAMLRAHPEFCLGKIEDCELRWLTKEGKWTALSLERKKDTPNEAEEYFKDDDRPAGEWLVWNKALKIGVKSRFNPAQVGTAMLNRNYSEGRFALELWTPETKLAPGKSLSLEHSYEIVHEAP